MSSKQALLSTFTMGISAVLSTLIGIAGTKYIAWKLGAEGVGVQSLFANAIGFLSGLFGFSLANSGTQYIAKYADRADHAVSNVIKTVVSLSYLQAVLAFLVVVFFSYVIPLNRYSQLLDSWTGLWMAIGSGCAILLAGYQAQINGFRWIKSLAILNIVIALGGVGVTCVLVYWIGLRGLNALLVAPYACGLILCFVIIGQGRTPSQGRASLEHLREIYGIGWVLTFGVIAVQSTQLVLRTWLEKNEGIVVVGLFHAAWLIGMTYIGFILTAMIADYYPRLSSMSGNSNRINEAVNDQISLCITITLPLMVAGLIYSKQVISLLYTSEFEPSSELLRFLMIGDLFKVAAWAIAIGLLVREYKRQYVIAEILWNALFLFMSLVLYEHFGLLAIGFAYVTAYVVYYFWTMGSLTKSTGFELQRAVQLKLIVSVLLLILVTSIEQHLERSTILSLILIAVVSAYSIVELWHITRRFQVRS